MLSVCPLGVTFAIVYCVPDWDLVGKSKKNHWFTSQFYPPTTSQPLKRAFLEQKEEEKDTSLYLS